MAQRYYQVLNYPQVVRNMVLKKVKFWVKRYEKERIESLKDKSKAPYHIPHETPKWIEDEIEKITKSKRYSIGQDRIQSEIRKLDVYRFTSTINRIMHDRSLIKKRKKKWKKKKQIQE